VISIWCVTKVFSLREVISCETIIRAKNNLDSSTNLLNGSTQVNFVCTRGPPFGFKTPVVPTLKGPFSSLYSIPWSHLFQFFTSCQICQMLSGDAFVSIVCLMINMVPPLFDLNEYYMHAYNIHARPK